MTVRWSVNRVRMQMHKNQLVGDPFIKRGLTQLRKNKLVGDPFIRRGLTIMQESIGRWPFRQEGAKTITQESIGRWHFHVQDVSVMQITLRENLANDDYTKRKWLAPGTNCQRGTSPALVSMLIPFGIYQTVLCFCAFGFFMTCDVGQKPGYETVNRSPNVNCFKTGIPFLSVFSFSFFPSRPIYARPILNLFPYCI